MKKNDHKPRYFVDLFAGCGGLSLGLEEAGWTPVFVNELNKDAMETYLLNRDAHYPWLRKFRAYDIKAELVQNESAIAKLARGISREHGVKAGELDLVVGGPPCQGFSGIGHRRSYSVHKKQLPSNHLYQDMAYVVSRLRPKMFLFENVRGLLNSKWDSKSKTPDVFKTILQEFRDIGEYDVRWSLVFAKDYGVPQNRPRVLMVGIRKDLGLSTAADAEDALRAGLLPLPTGGAPNLEDLLGDLVKSPFKNGDVVTSYPTKPLTAVQRALRHGAPKILTEHEYSHHSAHVIAKFQAMHENGGEIPESMRTKKFAQRLLPRKWDEKTGPTITACSLADDYVHFSQPRALTVREWARLQMFPDRYQFAGKRTTGGLRRAGNPRLGIFDRELPKYTQIGNAVPVKLAREVGLHFAATLQAAGE